MTDGIVMTEYKNYSDIKQFNSSNNNQIDSLDLPLLYKIMLNNPAFYCNYLILSQGMLGL
jgi:hypothetical protein